MALTQDTRTCVFPSRFNGPPHSANGGYACGVVASFLDGPAQVTLRTPPPLDRPMTVREADGGVDVFDGETLVGTGRRASPPTHEPPLTMSLEAAERAASHFAHFDHHVFPTCFVCGPKRPKDDGLKIFPGAVEGAEAVAAPWTADASLSDEDGALNPAHVWAALDCPTYFSFRQQDLAALLASFTVSVIRIPKIGERCIVMAWPLEVSGRKRRAASALLSAEGALYAIADALWIELRPETAQAVSAVSIRDQGASPN